MKEGKRYNDHFITILVILAVFLTLLPLTAQKVCAASKLAKVKGVKIARTSTDKATVSWKQVKGAKKYQVYLKYKGDRYELAKSTKAKKVKLKVKHNKKFFVKVRAVKGKKKGRFSKAKSFMIRVAGEQKTDSTTGNDSTTGDENGSQTDDPSQENPSQTRILTVKASVSGDVVIIEWDSAGEGCTYNVVFGRSKGSGIVKEPGEETTCSIRGLYGVKYYVHLRAYGKNGRILKDVDYEDIEVTIPEENDPTPPERTYVNSEDCTVAEYLEQHVFPDVYGKFKAYNGSNTDEYEKLKNMLKAMHALCSYGIVINNRFYGQVKMGIGADPELRYIPPAHVRYAVGCEEATMCMLYMCNKEGIKAFGYYPGHAYPIVKVNGIWLGHFADATRVLSRPGDSEELNLSGYYINSSYRLGKQFTDAAIKDVFSLESIFGLEYSTSKMDFGTSITWSGYTAEYSSNPRKYSISIDDAVFKTVGGDKDIITFDNTKKTFTTHGTGTATIQITCGEWNDEIELSILE